MPGDRRGGRRERGCWVEWKVARGAPGFGSAAHPHPTTSSLTVPTPARPRGLPVCALLHSQWSSLSPGWERLSPPQHLHVHTHTHTRACTPAPATLLAIHLSTVWARRARVFSHYIIMSQGKAVWTGDKLDQVLRRRERVFISYCVDDWHESHHYSGCTGFFLLLLVFSWQLR